MVSEMFSLWLKGCEMNKTQIYRLEGNGDTAVYKCQKSYEHKHYYYYESPVYMVWIAGKIVLSTTNYFEAISKYKEAVK
jgi:hypothetical protein